MAGIPAAANYFYPRSPCGERLHSAGPWQAGYTISIHALLAESDTTANEALQKVKISIHALLAESDAIGKYAQHAVTGISIHALLAESDMGNLTPISMTSRFLSTLSLRRATHSAGPWQAGYTISIHALLAESDRNCW